MNPFEFEESVRNFASLKWSRPCAKETFIGIEIDGVIRVTDNQYILLQVTQNETLTKFRKDILDLELVRRDLFDKNFIFSDCYIITEDEISSRQMETITAKKMRSLDFINFKRTFFDYSSYLHERRKSPFGSAVKPDTGEVENNIFIKVEYARKDRGNQNVFSYDNIISSIKRGKKIILKGEYGTGKSRLIQDVFIDLSAQINDLYVLAINLRDYRGVASGDELIRRHFRKYGLAAFEDAAIKCLNSDKFIFLIDGFDEVFVQSWSENPQKIRDIRFREFGFIREIFSKSKNGILITGREHFFNDDNEMIRALGVKDVDAIVIESGNEFTKQELDEFLRQNNILVTVPPWFPRKPMALRLLSDNFSDDLVISIKLNNQYLFWLAFFEYIAERDSQADQNILDPDAIKKLLLALANFTRRTPRATGPISLEELNSVFKKEFGFEAIEESAAYFQRLPGMGRVTSDSYDRQFTDDVFLDFLRVQNYTDFLETYTNNNNLPQWKNCISKNGIQLLSALLTSKSMELKPFISKIRSLRHPGMLSELISAALLASKEIDFDIDFHGISIENVESSFLDFSGQKISNISIANSIIYEMDITNTNFDNVRLTDNFITRLFGVSSRRGVESIFADSCEIEVFEQISSISKIKQTNLKPSQQYLVLMIQKVFYQKGSGRKEEVLTRGFNGIYDKKLAIKILHLLEREAFFTSHQGDDGKIYKGNKALLPRASKILEELTHSQDEIWAKVSVL